MVMGVAPSSGLTALAFPPKVGLIGGFRA